LRFFPDGKKMPPSGKKKNAILRFGAALRLDAL
jgi:hypothetical protein